MVIARQPSVDSVRWMVGHAVRADRLSGFRRHNASQGDSE